jgi:hypothetical protein
VLDIGYDFCATDTNGFILVVLQHSDHLPCGILIRRKHFNELPLFGRSQNLVIGELLTLHKAFQHITSANEAIRCSCGVASIFNGEVKVYPK